MFDPLQHLRRHWPTVRVQVRHIEGDECGITEWDHTGAASITLSPWLTRIEFRCVLTHELVHLKHGANHAQHCHEDEAAVRAETARWLLPDIHTVARNLVQFDTAEAARRMGVLEHVLCDRLWNATDDEREILDDALPSVSYRRD